MSVRVDRPVDYQPKHPEADTFHKLLWANWLESGETISTSVWEADSPLTLTAETIEDANTNTQVKIAGGVSGYTYKIKNTITTSNGQTEVGFIVIDVNDDPNNA